MFLMVCVRSSGAPGNRRRQPGMTHEGGGLVYSKLRASSTQKTLKNEKCFLSRKEGSIAQLFATSPIDEEMGSTT